MRHISGDRRGEVRKYELSEVEKSWTPEVKVGERWAKAYLGVQMDNDIPPQAGGPWSVERAISALRRKEAGSHNEELEFSRIGRKRTRVELPQDPEGG